MIRRKYKYISAALAAIAVICMVIRSGSAGEFHSGQSSVCSDCHIMHASKSALTWTPADKLLKNSSQVALCMTCHDGMDLQAPDIVASGTASSPSSTVTTRYSSKYGSSGGFLQSDYLVADNPCGHDLRASASVTAPLSTSYTKDGGLVCTDCHNPHGTPNFRNLRSDPNPNHAGSFDILIGTQVKEFTPVNVQSPNPAIAYDTANVALYAQNNIGQWCADCHDTLSQDPSGSSPAHFKSHPGNVEIGGTYQHIDITNWQFGTQGLATGFGIDIDDSTAGIPRVRYGSPTGSNTSAGSGDTVSCLSCHKAHGSKYRYSLVWPYYEGGADMLSGCQQCHYK